MAAVKGPGSARATQGTRSPVDVVLERLEGVKQRSRDQWWATCPVHANGQERTASLSIRECDDGTVLLKCFGCGAKGDEIAPAIGLEARHLFAHNDTLTYSHPKRPRVNCWDVMKLTQHSLAVVAMAAGDLARNKPLSEQDLGTLCKAIADINAIIEESRDA